MFPFVHASERALHSVDAGNVTKFLKKSYSSCAFLAFLNTKSRIFKAEIGVDFAHQEREDSARPRIVFEVATVHENVLFARVTMQIAVHYHLTLLMDGFH